MKNLKSISAILIGLACLRSTFAYSPISQVDHWNAESLAKVGITVSAWKHDRLGEDPPLEWVQVKFDCSRWPEDQDVLMTICITSKGTTVSAFRAQRIKGGGNTLSLLFAVREHHLENSHLNILIPNSNYAGDGHPVSGYILSLKRITELARQKTASTELKATE